RDELSDASLAVLPFLFKSISRSAGGDVGDRRSSKPCGQLAVHREASPPASGSSVSGAPLRVASGAVMLAVTSGRRGRPPPISSLERRGPAVEQRVDRRGSRGRG